MTVASTTTMLETAITSPAQLFNHSGKINMPMVSIAGYAAGG